MSFRTPQCANQLNPFSIEPITPKNSRVIKTLSSSRQGQGNIENISVPLLMVTNRAFLTNPLEDINLLNWKKSWRGCGRNSSPAFEATTRPHPGWRWSDTWTPTAIGQQAYWEGIIEPFSSTRASSICATNEWLGEATWTASSNLPSCGRANLYGLSNEPAINNSLVKPFRFLSRKLVVPRGFVTT